MNILQIPPEPACAQPENPTYPAQASAGHSVRNNAVFIALWRIHKAHMLYTFLIFS